MKAGSLRLRLAAAGAAAIAVALVLAGLGLSWLFERHAMRSMAEQLEADLRQVLGALNVDAAGVPSLRRALSDPKFAEPLSGFYWQITTDKGGALRSRSLWDASLPLAPDTLKAGEVHQHRIAGPKGSDLLAVERTVVLNAGGGDVFVRSAVAADTAQILKARRAFTWELVPSLILLGSVLAAATFAQITLGLRPLLALQEAIAAIRNGKTRRLKGDAPTEVAPLVEEINALLDTQERDLQRSRGRAADLAHGLKTPLAALDADIRQLQDEGRHEIAARIAQVSETMRRHVEHELARARIRPARTPAHAPMTRLRPLLDTLVTIQQRTAHGSRLTFDIAIGEDAAMAMDKADLAEVLGNLIENAARHARGRVRVSCPAPGDLAIDDDGPGIAPDERDRVLQRGARLDVTGEGAGLGLSIVSEILAANGRSLALATSDLGGLRVTVSLAGRAAAQAAN